MENNGRGIFYGVIGVATLVVAIIGATFAFFTAQAGGNTYQAATGAEVSLNWSDSKDTLFNTNLVPVETGVQDEAQEETGYEYNGVAYNAATLANTFATWQNLDPDSEDWCKDGLGNAICSAYTITITNPSAAAIEVEGDFITVANAGDTTDSMANLKFAIFRGTAADVWAKTGTQWKVIGNTATGDYHTVADGDILVTATDVLTTADAKNEVADKLDLRLEATGNEDGKDSATFTILLWIEEIGEEQTDGGAFTGKVQFTTAAGTGVTGILSA